MTSRFDVNTFPIGKRTAIVSKKGGVALVPGLPFGSGGEGYLRTSYATSLEECEEGMERIAGVMKEIV